MTDETDFSPEMFDHTAQIRPLENHDPADLARMSPERTAAFNALHDALANERAKETAVTEATHAIKKAQAVVELKEIALEKLAGTVSFHDVWRRDIARVEHNPHDPEVAKAIAFAQGELDGAREAVQICQQAYTTARHAVAPARALVANALRAYTSRFPVMTGVEGVKEHINRLAEHRQTAKDNYEHVEKTVASVLDAHLQGGRGAPGIRSTRQGQRNPVNPGAGTYPSSMQGRVIAKQTDPRAPIDGRGGKRS
jgi:hypothetical protein